MSRKPRRKHMFMHVPKFSRSRKNSMCCEWDGCDIFTGIRRDFRNPVRLHSVSHEGHVTISIYSFPICRVIIILLYRIAFWAVLSVQK